MKIKIGQIFRYTNTLQKTHLADFYELTKGIFSTGIGIGGKGIFSYGKIAEKNEVFTRIPAFILHSNPFKKDQETTPWVDIINSDEGYAIYNGDNKSSKNHPSESQGNKDLLEAFNEFYSNPEKRKFAPPILLFRQENIEGRRKGFRSFQGYGLPIKITLRTQKDRFNGGYFTNLVFEIVLFSLAKENEIFDWGWIDKRRDSSLTADKILKYAPAAWRQWVKTGNGAAESVRRRVTTKRIYKVSEQNNLEPDEESILKKTIEYYKNSKHNFEGLAAEIACRVIGERCVKGWVTKKSGDGGIDFVNKVIISNEISETKIVLLGQAKCIAFNSSINSTDLSRVAARLQRGWIGVYVTTGIFSVKAQEELAEDKYPIMLINGKTVARELKLMMNLNNQSLSEILEESSKWYQNNGKIVPAQRILDWEPELDLN